MGQSTVDRESIEEEIGITIVVAAIITIRTRLTTPCKTAELTGVAHTTCTVPTATANLFIKIAGSSLTGAAPITCTAPTKLSKDQKLHPTE